MASWKPPSGPPKRQTSLSRPKTRGLARGETATRSWTKQSRCPAWPCVSGTEFDRDMSTIVSMAGDARTVSFPTTVRCVRQRTSKANEALGSVVLNEVLEELGECGDDENYLCGGVFSRARIRHVALPSTLRVLGDNVFHGCRELGSVSFAEGSRLEKTGGRCFAGEIAEITLPRTLKTIHHKTFADCACLRNIYAEDGCDAALSQARGSHPVKVGPPPGTTAGSVSVWALRELRDVVIPEGTERVGSYWFWGSNVESVGIPASAREIGTEAFCYCASLRKVSF